MPVQTLKQKQQAQDKERQAYAFFTSQGWKPHQAIGIVGNLKRESGLNHNAVGDSGQALGLAQWHPDRQQKAKQLYGENWKSFENQLKFVDWELNNTEKSAGDKLRNSKGVWEAGMVVSDYYERPKVKFNADDARQAAVSDLAVKFKGIKLTPEDMPYYGATYANSVAPYMNPQDESQQPTSDINYFNIPQKGTTFASVPTPEEEKPQEKESQTEEDYATSAEAERVEKESNFLKEIEKLQNQDYAHLEPQKTVEQEEAQPVDYLQKYDEISQFIDEPIMGEQQSFQQQTAQQGLTWQEKLANRPKKLTVAELIAENNARQSQQNEVQRDNTFLLKPKIENVVKLKKLKNEYLDYEPTVLYEPNKKLITSEDYDNYHQSLLQMKQDSLAGNDMIQKSNESPLELTKGRLNLSKINKQIPRDLIAAANRQGVDPMLMLALAARENNLEGAIYNTRDPLQNKRLDPTNSLFKFNTKQSVVSGWNLANDYLPKDVNMFLADNKVPGFNVKKTKNGWEAERDFEKFEETENYLKNHPELSDKYKNLPIKNIKKLDSYDLAAKFIKEKGLKNYNPGDPKYVSDVMEDYQLLKQDPNIQKFLAQENKQQGGETFKTESNLSNDQEEKIKRELMFNANWYSNRKQVFNEEGVPKTIDASSFIPPTIPKIELRNYQGELGSYTPNEDLIELNKKFQNRERGTVVHEDDHRRRRYSSMDDKINLISTPIRNSMTTEHANTFSTRDEKSQDVQYEYDPSEIHANIQNLRFYNNLKPDQYIDEEAMKNIKIQEKQYLLEKFSSEEIRNMLNSTVYNDNLNKEGYFAQQGGEKQQNYAQQAIIKKPFQLQDERNLVQRDATEVNTQKFRPLKQLNVRNKTDKEIAAEREAKIQASVEAQKVPYTRENWRRQLAAETAATGDKLRVSNEPNFFDDYLNPAAMIGSMASNLGQAPLQAQQTDSILPYIASVGTPLAVGAMAGLGTQNTGQFVNNLANPLAGTGDLVNNLGNKVDNITNQLPEPEPFLHLDVNNPQSINLNRTERAGKNIYKETLEEGNLKIHKRGGTPENPKTITIKTKTGAIQATQNPDGSYMFHNAVDSKIDAGKAMLELNKHFPKKPTIFETSSMSTDSYTNLLKIGKNKDWKSSFEGFSALNDSNKNVNFLDDLLKWKNRGANAGFASEKNAIEAQRRMNSYLNKQGYDESAKIFQKNGEWQMEVPNYRVQRNYQQGGQQNYTENELAFLSEIAIKDNQGYWNPNNQGKVVEIDSPNITMKGVNQKLIGISKQTGEKKIMKPNRNYSFADTKQVIEIPFFKK